VSDAVNVDEDARPQEISPFCKYPFLHVVLQRLLK